MTAVPSNVKLVTGIKKRENTRIEEMRAKTPVANIGAYYLRSDARMGRTRRAKERGGY